MNLNINPSKLPTFAIIINSYSVHCTSFSSKYFAYTILIFITLALGYKLENQGLERLCDLFSDTQLVSSRQQLKWKDSKLLILYLQCKKWKELLCLYYKILNIDTRNIDICYSY